MNGTDSGPDWGWFWVPCLWAPGFLCLAGLLACGALVWYASPKNGCVAWGWPQCEFPRNFTIEALIIDESLFPDGTVATPITPTVLRGAQEHVFRTLSRGESHANHVVWRYATLSQADAKFQDLLGDAFWAEGIGAEYIELPFASARAQRFYAACATNQRARRVCSAVGQYDEYVVQFTSQIRDDLVTDADYVRILRAIDERMIQYLDRGGTAAPKTK